MHLGRSAIKGNVYLGRRFCETFTLLHSHPHLANLCNSCRRKSSCQSQLLSRKSKQDSLKMRTVYFGNALECVSMQCESTPFSFWDIKLFPFVTSIMVQRFILQ